MKVKRIVTDIAVKETALAKKFYSEFLGLDILMDIGWISTYGNDSKMQVQISFATEGGSGAPTPDITVEVDDLDVALERAQALDIVVEYGPTTEPWGVRRFFARDPIGKLVNVMIHL